MMLSAKNAAGFARDYLFRFKDIPKATFAMPRQYIQVNAHRLFDVCYTDPRTNETIVLLNLAVKDDGQVEVLADFRDEVRAKYAAKGESLPTRAEKTSEPRDDFRSAFAELTPDWPSWFVGIDFPRNPEIAAIVTYRKKDGSRFNQLVSVWRTNRDKANFYKKMPLAKANAHHGGIVVPHGCAPCEIRRRLFERLEAARRQ